MSAPLSDQERAALATVLAEHRMVFESDGDYGEMSWVECTCGDEYFVGTEADEQAHDAHVIEHLAAVVQTILDEREAGRG